MNRKIEKSLLSVSNLHIRYGSFEAVKGVSFTLAKGEILGIVGESGSGKSTIARTLIGLQKKSAGEIVCSARSMQMVFQDAVGSLNPRMTVRQTIDEVLAVSAKRDRASAAAAPRLTSGELLELVGLSPAVLDQYPREMSGGQCQRVSVARALACRPEILIADEPVSALDVSVQARILNLLRDLRRKLDLSILLIAHDLAVVKNVCDRICVMEKGLFVDSGPAEQVFTAPTSDYTKRLLSAVPDVTRALSRHVFFDIIFPMKKKILLGSFAALVAMCPLAAETVFLETEAFQDWGGWVNDTQFMDLMGSPYLLAHGMGEPVADARTTFTVAKGGAYDVWVRTKNWTAPWYPAVGAGLFRLVVNGTTLPNLLGAQGKGEWLWVKADAVTLTAGANTVALHDVDGFDGRCDAIVFTTEANPSAILNAPRRLSVPGEAVQSKDYEVVVVGGGIAGICAAVSSARLGLSTALVHDRPVLGGNNSSEVRVHLGAWQNMPPYPRLGDIVAEIGPRSDGNAMPKTQYEDERKLAVVKAEKNLDLFLDSRVNGVATNAEGRILSVTAQHTRDGSKHVFNGKLFVDCTGDGAVGFLAGADWRMGREAKSEFGEPWAPETPDMLTMGASVQWYAGKAEGKVAFPAKPWMVTFNEKTASRGLRGDWWWEAGLGRDQIQEAEYIRDYGLLVAYSNWAYLKNESAKKDEYADKELKWVAYNAGRRETRRLMGDFILTEKVLQEKDFQIDGTCVTTWTIDLHFPKKKEVTHFDGEPFQTDSHNHKIWPYPVPYRCLYSRNVPNLFMAGRDISVSHIALGTTRLMRTHGMMGEVVGMAAAVCRKHDCDPRAVYTTHLDELKALMEKGVGDGKAHPWQMYNIQQSLDPAFDTGKVKNHQIR